MSASEPRTAAAAADDDKSGRRKMQELGRKPESDGGIGDKILSVMASESAQQLSGFYLSVMAGDAPVLKKSDAPVSFLEVSATQLPAILSTTRIFTYHAKHLPYYRRYRCRLATALDKCCTKLASSTATPTQSSQELSGARPCTHSPRPSQPTQESTYSWLMPTLSCPCPMRPATLWLQRTACISGTI